MTQRYRNGVKHGKGRLLTLALGRNSPTLNSRFRTPAGFRAAECLHWPAICSVSVLRLFCEGSSTHHTNGTH